MPLYTYTCRDCGAKFEVLYFTGDPEPKCPQCQSADITRTVISSRSFSCPGQGGSSCSGSCASCQGCSH